MDATNAENPLEEYFFRNPGRLLHKWLHYFDIYDRHFRSYRDRAVTLLEIGVFHGGSLQMWKEYLGPEARIVGVDIQRRCLELTEPQIEIVIGDQGDRGFLASLRRDLGAIDIVIDDGGHRVEQQIATFEELFPSVAEGGTYLVEDLCTNYWAEYGGGFRRPDTFIEYAKRIVDQVHAWHSRDPESFKVDHLTQSVRSMHVYDSVIVLEKGAVSRPKHGITGRPSFLPMEAIGPDDYLGRLDEPPD